MSAKTNEKILNALNMYNKGLQTKLDNKFVQQVAGKNLSTNDFTDADKAKLDSLSSAGSVDIDTLTDTFVTKVTGKDLSTNDFTDAYKSTIDGLSGTYVQQISGKNLSTNDFTDAYKTTIDGLSGTYVQQVSGKDLSTNDFTDAYKTAIDGLSGTYAMKTDITKVYKLKGSVANFAALPTNADEGDVYNILAAGGTDENGIEIKAGDNVVKTATGWDVLGGTVDLTNYVQKVTGKDLSTNDFTDSYKNTIDGLSSVYVQQISGKNLSTNDFTDSYKNTIDGLSGVYVQKVTGKDLSTNDFTDAYKAKIDAVDTSTFVQKVTGKDLSTNDFTDADKAKLDSLSSGGSVDIDTLTDTFVTKVAGKDLSTNDFTDADKTKLDGLPAVSVFMKALLEADDAVAARRILQVGRADIFDEAGNTWQLLQGAWASTTLKKFGNKSLYFSGTNSYLWLPNCITLGGSDFSIAGWFYSGTASTTYQGLFSFGNATYKIHVARNTKNMLYWSAEGTTSFNTNASTSTTFPLSQWNHIEVCYKYSSNTLYLFLNGALVNSQTATWFQTAQSYPMYLGVTHHNFAYLFKDYVDEFYVTKQCLHTANFTPPTNFYAYDDENTLALLHFEELKTIDDSVLAHWRDYGVTYSTSLKKFDKQSINTSSGYLQAYELILGGKDFAAAGWFYAPAEATATELMFGWGNSKNYFFVARNAGDKIYCGWYINANAVYSGWSTSTTAFSTGNWHHVEFNYRQSDNKMLLFLDGVLADEGTATNFPSSATVECFAIGSRPTCSTNWFKGNVDSFIITEKLLHTANFTPPTEAYTADSDTLALLNFE